MSSKKCQMEGFFDRLNWLIEDKSNGNVTEFSKKTGIKQPTLHKYTNGRFPNVEALYSIRNSLNVDINWLLTGSGEHYLGNTSDNNIVELEHISVVKNFTNKKKNLEINQKVLSSIF